MSTLARSPTTQSRLRRIAVNVLMALASFLVVVVTVGVVGEGVVRYRETHRTTVPGTMPMLFYQHGELGLALVRDYDYFGWVHINRYGFRGSDVSQVPEDGTYRIMAVGGSTTFDTFVTGDDKTWPARLEHWLQALGSDTTVEVINAGVPGYTVRKNMLRLEKELYRFQPDLILLHHAHNDLFGALRRGVDTQRPFVPKPGHVPVITPWKQWISSHSLLYAKLVGRWQAIRFRTAGRKALHESSRPSSEQTIEGSARRFERDLITFLNVAEAEGIPVVLIGVSNISGPDHLDPANPAIEEMWRRAVPFATPTSVRQGYKRFNQTLASVAARTGTRFISSDPFDLVGPEWYSPGDVIHFNDIGADRMGRALAGALLDGGVLEATVAPSTTQP